MQGIKSCGTAPPHTQTVRGCAGTAAVGQEFCCCPDNASDFGMICNAEAKGVFYECGGLVCWPEEKSPADCGVAAEARVEHL